MSTSTLFPSTSRVRIELASADDDLQLRELLHAMPMGERIAVKFLREPSFFCAAGIQGDQVQTIVGRRNGRIIGFGTRAIRRTYINGEVTDAGYLSDLRLLPAERRGTSLARGYRFLRELHEENPVDVYSTVIVADNRRAISTITAGRAGLPTYTPLGRIFTPMIQLRGTRRPSQAVEIIRGDELLLPRIVTKLNENRLQFAPAYTVDDFTNGRFPSFLPEDFYVLMREGRIAGVAGVWDQHAFRQTVISSYGEWLKQARPLVNLFRRPKLPRPGSALRYFNISFIATDDTPAFAALLRQIYNDALGGPWTHFTVALHENDPRAEILNDYRSDKFAGRLYAVTFDQPPDFDDRTPYIDAGLL